MIARFKPCKLYGSIDAPPSKSMAHRYLIGAALTEKKCKISGVDYSEDILASIDCLRALGAGITIDNDTVTIDPKGFMKKIDSYPQVMHNLWISGNVERCLLGKCG